jgi:hypothetical protein
MDSTTVADKVQQRYHRATSSSQILRGEIENVLIPRALEKPMALLTVE